MNTKLFVLLSAALAGVAAWWFSDLYLHFKFV